MSLPARALPGAANLPPQQVSEMYGSESEACELKTVDPRQQATASLGIAMHELEATTQMPTFGLGMRSSPLHAFESARSSAAKHRRNKLSVVWTGRDFQGTFRYVNCFEPLRWEGLQSWIHEKASQFTQNGFLLKFVESEPETLLGLENTCFDNGCVRTLLRHRPGTVPDNGSGTSVPNLVLPEQTKDLQSRIISCCLRFAGLR